LSKIEGKREKMRKNVGKCGKSMKINGNRKQPENATYQLILFAQTPLFHHFLPHLNLPNAVQYVETTSQFVSIVSHLS
jgi:hypothetical protein